MNKTELMESYTAEQLAEMVIKLRNASKVKNDEIHKLKWQISNLEEESGRLQTKIDTYSNYLLPKATKEAYDDIARNHYTGIRIVTCEQWNSRIKQELNEPDIQRYEDTIDKLQSEVEKYRKAFEDAKKERDCKIAEYQNRTEKDKTELERAKNTINQIDYILEKLFGVRHDAVDNPDEFEKILSDKAKGNIDDFLPTEPIKVADMLINEFRKGDNYTYLGISESRQIAEHLLVYCNHNGEEE